jgi:hypothetical protein
MPCVAKFGLNMKSVQKKMQSPNQICSALPPALAETPATPPYTTFLFSVGRPEFAFQAAIPLP